MVVMYMGQSLNTQCKMTNTNGFDFPFFFFISTSKRYVPRKPESQKKMSTEYVALRITAIEGVSNRSNM